jgi:TatD DNase family protein
MSMRYIDTHAHLNLPQFSDDLNQVIERNQAERVGVINVGTRQATSERAVQFAKQYAAMWAIVGLHPLSVVSTDPDEIEEGLPESKFDQLFYRELANDPKVVGIGECGFDYFHHSEDTYEVQREAFLAQIELANQLGKPLMLHLRNSRDGQRRNAYDDALEILRSTATVPGNAHFFAGTIAQAKAFFDLGFTVSFTGVITFASGYRELVEYMPLDLMHAETDCPYVAPKPYRGERAEPWMVQEVYKKIAVIKGVEEERVREQLIQNARRLYQLER